MVITSLHIQQISRLLTIRGYDTTSIELVSTYYVCLVHTSAWVSSWLYVIFDYCAIAIFRLCYVCGKLFQFIMALSISLISSDSGASKKEKAITTEVKLDIKHYEKGETTPMSFKSSTYVYTYWIAL